MSAKLVLRRLRQRVDCLVEIGEGTTQAVDLVEQPQHHRDGVLVDAEVVAQLGDQLHAGEVAVVEHQGAVEERKSVVEGQSVSVRVELGGRRIIKKKTKKKN